MEDRADLAAVTADFIQMVYEIEQQEVDFIVDAILNNAGASIESTTVEGPKVA